jgi:hypothetical protein
MLSERYIQARWGRRLRPKRLSMSKRVLSLSLARALGGAEGSLQCRVAKAGERRVLYT